METTETETMSTSGSGGDSPYTRIMLVGNSWKSQNIHPGHDKQYAAIEAALAPVEESLDAMFTALDVNDYFARWLLETERLDRDTFKRLWRKFSEGEQDAAAPGQIGRLIPELVGLR